LERCLAREPEDRWQSAVELKTAIEQIRPAARRATFLFRMPSFRRAWIAAAAILVAVLAWAVWPKLQRERVAPEQVTRFSLALPPGVAATRLNLSPDERSVAFVGGNRLYVRSFDELEPRVVSQVEGMGTPFWSPDGRQVAVASGGRLRVYNLSSGMPAVLADVNTNVAGAWGADGTILIGVLGDGIFRVPASGGKLVRATTVNPARGETRHMLPQFLPGGRRFLYLAGSANAGSNMLFAASLDSAERTPIMPIESSVAFVPLRKGSQQGYLVFVRGGSLMAQAFDAAALRASGQPREIASAVVTNPALGASLEIAHFSATGSALAYLAGARAAVAGQAVANHSITVVQNWIAGLPR